VCFVVRFGFERMGGVCVCSICRYIVLLGGYWKREIVVLCTKIEKIGYICNNDAFVLGIPFGWMEGKEKCKYKALLESRR